VVHLAEIMIEHDNRPSLCDGEFNYLNLRQSTQSNTDEVNHITLKRFMKKRCHLGRKIGIEEKRCHRYRLRLGTEVRLDSPSA